MTQLGGVHSAGEALVPRVCDAARRARVRFRVGGRVRVGALMFWPVEGRGRVTGAKARVVDSAGNWLSVRPDDVELLEEELCQ